MAIYHFAMKIIGRSSGRSATAAAAYRSGAIVHDERTGETFDYQNKQGVLDHAILTPSRAPDWAKDTQSLWNAVEQFERRKDAQVVRENIIALPHELTLEQNKELLHGFVHDAYIKRGMVAQIDIHGPDKGGSNKNIHAHVMLTTRQITRNGFKKIKPRNWNDRETLKDWRTLWADHVNQALERAGKKERVDSRSFKDQGIDQEPTTHMGVEATAMERRGETSRQGDKNRAVHAANKAFADLKAEKAALDLQIKAEEKEEARAARKKNVKVYQQRKDDRLTKIRQAKARGEARAEKLNALHLKQLDERRSFEQKADFKRDQALKELQKVVNVRQAKQSLKTAEREHENSKSLFNRVTGKTDQTAEKVAALKQNLKNAQQREQEWMSRIEAQIKKDETALTVRQEHEKEQLTAVFRQENEPQTLTQAERDQRTAERIRKMEEQREQAEQTRNKGKGRELGR